MPSQERDAHRKTEPAGNDSNGNMTDDWRVTIVISQEAWKHCADLVSAGLYPPSISAVVEELFYERLRQLVRGAP